MAVLDGLGPLSVLQAGHVLFQMLAAESHNFAQIMESTTCMLDVGEQLLIHSQMQFALGGLLAVVSSSNASHPDPIWHASSWVPAR